MTALQLLSYIVVAIAVQLAAGLGIAFWRWRRARAASASWIGGARTLLPPAWSGWRDFVVTQRTPEDASGSQNYSICSRLIARLFPTTSASFYLDVPVADAQRSWRCDSLLLLSENLPQTVTV
jgi:hypothetical protein